MWQFMGCCIVISRGELMWDGAKEEGAEPNDERERENSPLGPACMNHR